LIIVVVALVVVGAVAGYWITRPPPSAILTYYSEYDIATLDPADAYDSGSFIPIQNCYDTLVGYPVDSISTLVPVLATDWSVSSDGLVYTFNLRKNVKFSNGNPLTAEDVVYTFQRILTMNSPSSGVAWIISQDLDINSVKALDDYTVQFTLTHPFNPFLQTLATVEPSGIVDKETVEAHGGVAANEDNQWMTENTVGTGPYVVESWTRGQQVTMVKNPNYWGGWNGRHYDKIVMLLNQQPSTSISAAMSGAATIADIPFDQAETLSGATNFKMISHPVPRTKLLTFDVKSVHTFMADKAVRVALSWAFPYDDVIAQAFRGYAAPLNGPVPAQIYLGVESNPTKYYSFDLDKAAAVLDQAGYVKNADGLRFDGTALTLYSDSTYAWATTAGQLYQSALTKIGIVTDLRSVPASTRLAVQKTNEWDMMIVTWGPDYNDPNDYALPFVGSTAVAGDVYYTGYSNPVIDDALIRAMETTDTAEQTKYYTTVWEQANQDPNMIFMAVTSHIAAVSNSLTNFSYNAITTYNFYAYTPV
jgi:peptide/nickel transport system substrate-binding protein